MTINLIAVGKLEKDFQKLFDEYAKRIFAFSKFNLIEIKENTLKNLEVKKRKKKLWKFFLKSQKIQQYFYLALKVKIIPLKSFQSLLLMMQILLL